MKLTITVLNKEGIIKDVSTGEDSVKMVYRDGYSDGDMIKITTDTPFRFYQIKIDETIEKCIVYLTKNEWYYMIDFNELNKSLHPNAFDKSVHYLYVKAAQPNSLLSFNPLDQKENYGMYPHVHANVETAGNSAFACLNVIDGLDANTHHGKWPYTSWGIAGRKDASLTIEFGRMVRIEKVIIYLRAQFPHDSWWCEGKLELNNELRAKLLFEKTEKKQIYYFDNIETNQIHLYDLIKADDQSEFPSLTLIEVYGEDIH
ncbi:MAG: hypothetical protein RR558_11305 [Coprobacillus sp.]